MFAPARTPLILTALTASLPVLLNIGCLAALQLPGLSADHLNTLSPAFYAARMVLPYALILAALFHSGVLAMALLDVKADESRSIADVVPPMARQSLLLGLISTVPVALLNVIKAVL